ncbi:unnamed protein product [Paramecium sonneborni]|uniref:Uncharacterized protein n=1 Tax=Paramecium sonneborni TaxID=65129 RepID=A0A8S1Q0Z6_9CILI|nr:unnamed protein product [Paramecium sonneborni]
MGFGAMSIRLDGHQQDLSVPNSLNENSGQEIHQLTSTYVQSAQRYEHSDKRYIVNNYFHTKLKCHYNQMYLICMDMYFLRLSDQDQLNKQYNYLHSYHNNFNK